MTGPERVVEHARAMLGVRWRHQGRKPWAVDCLGLVELSLVAAGWPGAVVTPARYGREPWDDQLRRGLQKHFGDPVPVDEVAPGDIALFRAGASEPSHVGILGDHPHGGLSVIHASNHAGKVVETSLSGFLHAGLIAAYRPQWGDA